jgi:PAS domain S-box-containing protein
MLGMTPDETAPRFICMVDQITAVAESEGTESKHREPAPTAVYNPQQERFEAVNQQMARLLGAPIDELVGNQTLPCLDVDGGVPELCAALEAPAVVDCTLPGGRRGRATLVPRTDTVAVVVDSVEKIDERAHERLRHQTTVLDTIVQHMPVTLFTLDAEGRYTRLEGQTLEYVSMDPGAVVGQSIFEATDHEGFHEAARRALDGEAVERDLTFDGRTSRSWYQPVFDAEGAVEGVVGFALDITERRRREQISEVLSRVLRHNLRNDMNVILGSAADLSDHQNETVRAIGNQITATAERLLSLSETAREMRTRVLAGERMAPLPVGEVVEHTVHATAEEYPEADLRVHIDDQPTATASGVDAVVTELIENAIRHNDDDPSVDVTVETTDGDVRLVIADDGPGLPAMEREVLNEGQESPLAHGQGLGLWLVNWLVEDAGGEFHVDVTDTGTRAIVRYPR